MHFFHIDFSIIFSFWHCIDIFNEFFTIKSHKYSIINVAKNIWKFWNTMMLSKSWCDLHFRQYRTIQTIDICFIMYRLFNFRYQFSHRCFISWKFKTRSQFFKCSIARFTIRFYVIFEINKLSNFDSFVFAIFASMYNLILQNLRHRKSLFENFKQHIVEKVLKYVSLKNHIVEKISKFVALKKFARKFQIEFVKIQNRKHKRLL